jgi:predicted ATP-grasp superfamily ATP-dependent carboligase
LHNALQRVSTLDNDAPLIVIAESARLIAESLRRGGFDVIVFDQFGDLDTRACATQFFLIDDWSSDALISKIEWLSLDHQPVVIYGSGIDNDSDLLRQLQRRYQLLGNSVDTVRQVRNPRLFFRMLDDLGIAYPAINFEAPLGRHWLQKESNLEGGLGIRPAHLVSTGTIETETECYFQQRLQGESFSVLFLADGKNSRIIGLNSQWVVDNNVSQPYLFQGLANRFFLSDQLRSLVVTWISGIVDAAGLQGLNSLDCLNVDGEIVVLEVNPRPSASVALYDQDYAHGLLAEHIKSFTGEAWSDPVGNTQVRGSWVVYAPINLRIDTCLNWPQWVGDRPVPATEFQCGEPVCTVQASADSVDQVKQKLMQRCDMIINSLV